VGETITYLQSLSIELYNVSAPGLAFGALSTLQEFIKSGELGVYLLLTDASLANLICQQKGFGARNTFLSGNQTGISSGGQLSAMVGPVESIQFAVTGGRWAGTQPGALPRGDSLSNQLIELQNENRNVNANPEIAPHFVQDGATIWHNAAGLVLGGASSVIVSSKFAQFIFNQAATSVQCPSEWSRATCFGGLATAFGKDGQRVEAAGLFKGLYQSELAVMGIQQ